MTTASPLPDYPMARAEECPFDPPAPLLQLQRQAALAKVAIFGRPVWLVTRHADQRRLLADKRISADVFSPGFPGPTRDPLPESERGGLGFAVMDDPEHARLRRMATAPFSIKRVEAMRAQIQLIADRLIDAMLEGPRPTDLVTGLATPMSSQVMCELMGVPYEDRDSFEHDSNQFAISSSPMQDRIQARVRIGKYLDKLVGERMVDPGDDLLSDLAAQVSVGALSRQEAAGSGVAILAAGYESVANMIALGTLTLLEHPDQFESLRSSEDPSAMTRAVEELLRFLTITHQGRRRQVVEDMEYDGFELRAGDGIVFPIDIGNRDPSVYPEADHLDLSRDARGHLAFGFGPHACIGQPLARLELQLVYATLLRRIPTLRSAVPLDEIEFKHNSGSYGVRSLPVTW